MDWYRAPITITAKPGSFSNKYFCNPKSIPNNDRLWIHLFSNKHICVNRTPNAEFLTIITAIGVKLASSKNVHPIVDVQLFFQKTAIVIPFYQTPVVRLLKRWYVHTYLTKYQLQYPWEWHKVLRIILMYNYNHQTSKSHNNHFYWNGNAWNHDSH